MRDPRGVSLLRYEVAGIVFIVFLGSFLHFAYELSGSSPLVAVIAAVNESVWEHLKLAYWPAVFYMILELVFLRGLPRNFVAAKAAGILIMPLVIVAGYYLYTAFLPESLAIDIGLFIASIVVGQMLGYSLMGRGGEHRWFNLLGAAALTIMAPSFIIFTFHAPHIDLFRDPITSSYGLA